MLTSEAVKQIALGAGADLVGIAPMDRWEGAPAYSDARQIAPDAKSMIVLGFRIPRGTLRGVEEGTFYISYSSMGYAAINFILQPMVIWQITAAIEDAGFEAVPIPNNFSWSQLQMHWATGLKEDWSVPVGPDKPAPDVFVPLRLAAFMAGLGEIGWSKMFLSPKFGPRQRLACILTDLPLEPDEIYSGPQLCDRCMMCVRDCTGGALSADESVTLDVAGHELEWGALDEGKCGTYFSGGSEEYNPFMVTEEDREAFQADPREGSPHTYKVAPTYVYGRALEGARGCLRACMVHLEEQGKLTNTFDQPFRRRPQWKLDWPRE